MDIVKNLVKQSMYDIKCPYEMTAEFIVVHNTANDAPARNEISYMINNKQKVSFHYAVDNEEIVQGIPENRNAWHCGDGSNGKGNRKGLSIEICYSKSGGEKFVAAERLAAKFIAFKLKENGWDIDKVKKHQDFNGKNCPHRTLSIGWGRFLKMIQAELNALNSDETNKKGTVKVEVSVLKKGDKGNTVKALQLLLIGYGISCGRWGADGSFGDATVTAVKAYQKKRGLTVDGIVGTNTWNKLLGIN